MKIKIFNRDADDVGDEEKKIFNRDAEDVGDEEKKIFILYILLLEIGVLRNIFSVGA